MFLFIYIYLRIKNSCQIVDQRGWNWPAEGLEGGGGEENEEGQEVPWDPGGELQSAPGMRGQEEEECRQPAGFTALLGISGDWSRD